MPKFWRTKEFEETSRYWDRILEESGFVDAEKEIAGERTLKQSADYAYRRIETTEIVRDIKLTYFMLLAEHIARETKFVDESDRLIMERTAEGWTIQEISRELKTLGARKNNRDTIRYIRRRYEDRWGIRNWKPEEMVSRRVRSR